MRLLIGCLLLCCSSSAQITFPLTDSSIVKTIDLPSREPFDISRKWQRFNHNNPYVYIISDRDLYRNFDYATTMRFYGFNFADYHILGELECRQCRLFCRHDQGHTACHRNRCNKEWLWVMRENQKAFNEVSLTALPYHLASSINGRNPFLIDTLIKPVDRTSRANWYTTGHGDCFASFTYNLYTDKYHPVLLLKESNHWGGCRAGGSRSYALSFSMPAGVLFTTKNTILVEKYNDID